MATVKNIGTKTMVSGVLAFASAWMLAQGAPFRTVDRAYAHEEAEALPEGPLRDRHELMEEIGDNAKTLGKALKANDAAAAAAPARAIANASKSIVRLFPEGSTHPKSRAKPEIWERFEEFKKMALDLQTAATALADDADAGKNLDDRGRAVMKTCKQCHEAFRKPKEKH